MPRFSQTSEGRLDTCHQDLQTLFHNVVKGFDCSVIHGHRTPEEQFILYQKGRKLVGTAWVIEDKSKVVTYKDGFISLSRHNSFPSTAVDVCPYPIDWGDIVRFKEFVSYVKGVADMLLRYGAIEHEIESGGSWSLNDWPHFQLKVK